MAIISNLVLLALAAGGVSAHGPSCHPDKCLDSLRASPAEAGTFCGAHMNPHAENKPCPEKVEAACGPDAGRKSSACLCLHGSTQPPMPTATGYAHPGYGHPNKGHPSYSHPDKGHPDYRHPDHVSAAPEVPTSSVHTVVRVETKYIYVGCETKGMDAHATKGLGGYGENGEYGAPGGKGGKGGHPSGYGSKGGSHAGPGYGEYDPAKGGLRHFGYDNGKPGHHGQHKPYGPGKGGHGPYGYGQHDKPYGPGGYGPIYGTGYNPSMTYPHGPHPTGGEHPHGPHHPMGTGEPHPPMGTGDMHPPMGTGDMHPPMGTGFPDHSSSTSSNTETETSSTTTSAATEPTDCASRAVADEQCNFPVEITQELLDYLNTDVGSFPNANTADECGAACAGDDTCEAYLFAPNAVDSENGDCALVAGDIFTEVTLVKVEDASLNPALVSKKSCFCGDATTPDPTETGGSTEPTTPAADCPLVQPEPEDATCGVAVEGMPDQEPLFTATVEAPEDCAELCGTSDSGCRSFILNPDGTCYLYGMTLAEIAAAESETPEEQVRKRLVIMDGPVGYDASCFACGTSSGGGDPTPKKTCEETDFSSDCGEYLNRQRVSAASRDGPVTTDANECAVACSDDATCQSFGIIIDNASRTGQCVLFDETADDVKNTAEDDQSTTSGIFKLDCFTCVPATTPRGGDGGDPTPDPQPTCDFDGSLADTCTYEVVDQVLIVEPLDTQAGADAATCALACSRNDDCQTFAITTNEDGTSCVLYREGIETVVSGPYRQIQEGTSSVVYNIACYPCTTGGMTTPDPTPGTPATCPLAAEPPERALCAVEKNVYQPEPLLPEFVAASDGSCARVCSSLPDCQSFGVIQRGETLGCQLFGVSARDLQEADLDLDILTVSDLTCYECPRSVTPPAT